MSRVTVSMADGGKESTGASEASGGDALFALVSLPVMYLLSGLVLSCLWGWFAVPLTGWPAFTPMHGAGLAVLKNHITYRYSRVERTVYEATAQHIGVCLLMLICGWIFKGLM